MIILILLIVRNQNPNTNDKFGNNKNENSDNEKEGYFVVEGISSHKYDSTINKMGKKVWTILLFQVKWDNSNETTFETRDFKRYSYIKRLLKNKWN